MASRGVFIRKADGAEEAFNDEKLYTSLANSGADEDLARSVTRAIGDSLQPGENTRDIYRRAFRLLRQQEGSVAARYSVKRALLDLGPTGYPFEDFVAEIWKSRGYDAVTRQLRKGKCAEHELDMVARKGDEELLAEVKFHNKNGVKSDLKVALYVHARFLDLRTTDAMPTRLSNAFLITNTKFTEQVELYAQCVGLNIISWDYPTRGNLRELIEEAQLHPLSCLTTLSQAHKNALMRDGYVLCRHLYGADDALVQLGLGQKAIDKVHGEIARVCPAE